MAETILTRSSNEQFKDDYTRYALYTTYKRVLSDMRDGLKPVQRRILYTMFKNTGAVNHTVKSAAVVGDVMKYYHPHSNCLRGNTIVYSLDNTYHTIKDLYDSGANYLHVLSVNPTTGKIEPAVATNFRIGKTTNTIYHVILSNGAEVQCTDDHRFMMNDLSWVCAKDLKPGSFIYSDRMLARTYRHGETRPYINDTMLHILVCDYYNGQLPAGYERHHLDWNPWNNSPENIKPIPSVDHKQIHKGSESAMKGLANGRKSMFESDGITRERIITKNSILMKEFNKDQGIRRFKYCIGLLNERGLEINIENYESLRGEVYNLPMINRLLVKYPECKGFNDLVNYKVPTIGELYNERRSEVDSIVDDTEYIDPMIFFKESRSGVFKTLSVMLRNGIELTPENYAMHSGKDISNPNEYFRIENIINLYKLEKPYVVGIQVEYVDNEPMYDFTVEGKENMLIPVGTTYNEIAQSGIGFNMPFVCVHNSGIYGAIKPMVNWFESKVPILDSQGSFGNLQGDPAAAERYTEVKLSKFAMDCVIGELADTDKAVDWIPNYSNTTFEPEFLPCKIPLLLIEGSLGIGVGLRADIPSHNLNEVIDATISLMHDPNQNVILIPDHCMPCYIYNTDWEKISKTGFGHYKIRGIIDIEDYKNKKALVIKSVPDLTFLDTIKYKLEELVEKKKIIQIENMFDECTIDKMRFVIVLKNGADPDYVREVIYKNTKMEQTLRINLETLYGFNPLRMSYKSYLLSFIDFRKNTKFRLYTNILQDVQTKIHEREAYIRVLESGEIDNIIKMIKKQKTVDDNELIAYLMKKLKITDLQAKYIINADLRKLSIGYLNKYKEEAKNYEALRQKYMSILMDERLIEAEIEQELLDIKAKYGKPRTCKLITGTDDDVNIPRGMMQIAVTEKNFIRKVPEGTAIGSFRNDTIRTLIRIDNTDSMLIFDEQGRVFKLPVHKIPFTDRNSNGVDIRFMIKGLTANINCIIPESVVKELAKKGSHNNKHYLITITRNGLYKRMDLDDFCTVPPSGILYAKLEQGDFIKDIIIAHSNFNIIVYSDRKAVSVNVNDIPYLKRNTKGSKSIYNADVVDGLCVIDQTKSDIIVITDTGKINRIPIMSLPIGQNKKGFNVIKLGANDNINSIVSGNDSNIICVKTVKNYYEIPVSQLTIGSSISGGEKLVPMKADQMIRCWIK